MPEVADAEMVETKAGLGNGAATEVQNENGAAALKQLPEVAAIKYLAVRPYLFIEAPKAAAALAFYKKAFGAEELERVSHPKRKAEQEEPLIMHAHIRVGGADIYLADEQEGNTLTTKSPAALNGTSFILYVLTNDVDAAVARAVEAGATVGSAPADQEYGERYGMVVDPYGYAWGLSTPLSKDPTPVEAVQAA